MAKAAQTAQPRGMPRRSARRPSVPRWALAAGLAAVMAVAAAVWAFGRGDDDRAAQASIEHVHGLGVNPADGTLYAAAHNGVFQLPAGGPPRRAGAGRQDTMGFTVVGANHFLASGHPAPGQDGPAHLGLIESTDAGVTWRTLSLSGGADFHALRYRHDTVYGYNAVGGQLMVSRDKATWETRATIALRDVAVSPANPDTLLAAGPQGLVRSTDGGRTWIPAGGPPVVLLAWERSDRLWGVSGAGEVLRSADAGAGWSVAGRVPGTPTAFTAAGDDLYVAVHDGRISRSTDNGATWAQIYS